jgi:hypothetical protein
MWLIVISISIIDGDCDKFDLRQYSLALIPIDGEVAWELPTGLLPCWREHLNDIKCEFAN